MKDEEILEKYENIISADISKYCKIYNITNSEEDSLIALYRGVRC